MASTRACAAVLLLRRCHTRSTCQHHADGLHGRCAAAASHQHPPQALSVIQQAAAFQDDSHSQAVASATLAALVPAWLDAGRGSEELWGSLLDALPRLPAVRRLALLEALLAALPQVGALAAACVVGERSACVVLCRALRALCCVLCCVQCAGPAVLADDKT